MKIHCEYDKTVALKDLVPHPLNPNVHSEDQIKKLARIIKYFGWRKCITVSKQTNYVIRGHGRLAAAQLAGLKVAPVNYQKYKTNDMELADLAADNRLSELSEMQEAAAFELMDVLDGSGFDLRLAGFDIGEFKSRAGAAPGPGVFDDRPDEYVQLDLSFLKREVTRIMKILNAGNGDPVATLLRICRGEKKVVRWNVSHRWASKKINCTLKGILSGCLGACCSSPMFWPPKSGKNGCDYLSDKGCTLAPKDKSIICLMYPFVVNTNNTLGLHGRALLGHCKKNYSKTKGEPIIVHLKANLIELFGRKIYNEMLAAVLEGREFSFEPPKKILDGIKREDAWALANKVPGKRSEFEK